MPGLLENIGNKIEGVLGNPFVQGAVGAAVGGVSPLLGLLAGPLIKTDRERAKLKNDLLRSELTKRNRENQAQQALQGLLSGEKKTTVQDPDRVAGLLDVGGGDPALFNLPSRRESVPAIGTPQGQQQLLGLLAGSAPVITADSLLNPTAATRPTAFDQKLDLFTAVFPNGVPENPDSTETALLEFIGAAKPPLDPNIAALTQLSLEEQQRAAEQSRLATAERLIGTKAGLTQAGRRIESISKAVQNLGGTFLQPGLPATDARKTFAQTWSALSQFATGEVPQTQKDLATFDTFTKNTANLLIDISSSLSGSSGLGTFTDSKLDLLKSATANADIQPQAIISIIGDVAFDLLIEADKVRLRDSEFSIPNADFLKIMASGGTGVDLFGRDNGLDDSVSVSPPPIPAGRREKF